MSTQFNSRGPVAGGMSHSDTQFPKDRNLAPLNPGLTNQSVNDEPPMSPTCRFAPFDEHLNELVTTPSWQRDLDAYFTNIFKKSVLSECLIDDIVKQVLQIVGRPTQTKIRGLALAIYMQWMRMQFRCKDANVSAPEIVTFISRITDHLGWISVHAQKDFLDELNHLCIERLKLTWRWVRC